MNEVTRYVAGQLILATGFYLMVAIAVGYFGYERMAEDENFWRILRTSYLRGLTWPWMLIRRIRR